MSKAAVATAEKVQPDLLSGTAPQAAKKPPARKSTAKGGTALAVDDPKKRAEVAAAKPADESSLSYLLLQAARDKEVDAEKAKAMFELYQKVQAHDAKTAFTRAFIALQRELPVIDKDGRIEHGESKRTGAEGQKSRYATYPNLMDVCKPLLDKHGFALGSWIEPGEAGKIEVVTQLDHQQGHHRVSRFPLTAETSGSKNNLQGWGSSESYGMRYNAIALLNIVSKAPEDRDLDGRPNTGNVKRARDGFVETEPVEGLTDQEQVDLNAKMVTCKVPLAKFLQHFGIEKLEQLPRNLLASAIKQCDDYYAEWQKRQQGGDFPGDRQQGGGRRGR